MIQRLAGDADADIGHVGEIRQRLLSRHMVLTEDHLAIGAVFGAPGTNPTLQASTQPIPILTGMTQLHLLEQGNWSQTRMRLEHRADLAIPQSVKRIGNVATANGSWRTCQMPIARHA